MNRELFERRDSGFWIALGLLLTAVVTGVDLVTGPEVSLSVFYLIPIGVVTWFTGRWVGLAFAVIAAFGVFAADSFAGPPYSYAGIRYWNAAVRFGFFVVVAYLLPALKALEHERALSRIDDLTGASNRRFFFEAVERELARCRRYKRPLTVAFVDVDNFKAINDQFGHLRGDAVLTAVASRAKRELRETDTVARLGGDEFAILLPEINQRAANVVINKLRHALGDEMQRRHWTVTFSIGALTCLQMPESGDELMRRVDDLMYSAKARGKNAVSFDVYAA